MAVALPASIQADFLVLRRAGWTMLARSVGVPSLLVLVCWLLASVSLYRRVEWLTAVSAAVALAGSYMLVRSRLLGALVRSRFGWCGALPVSGRHTSGVLLALTASALVVAVVCGTLLLVFTTIPAPYPGNLDLALFAVDGGLAIGTSGAAMAVLRKGAVVRSHHAEGIREPLLALPWLRDARLPHLLDWQRRAALVRWRRGGGFALVGCVLAMVPTGAVMVVALVLLALSLVWFSVVMRACAAATADVRQLLGAVPIDLRRMYQASLRYPLFASVCAASFAVTGAVLLRSFVPLAVWVACAMAIAVAPIWGIASATKAGRST